MEELDFISCIELIKLEMGYQKISQKDLSDKLGSYDFSIDIVKKFFSNKIKDPIRRLQFVAFCLQKLEIPVLAINEMIEKYKEIECTQKCDVIIYKNEIRPILEDCKKKEEKDKKKYTEEHEKLKQQIKMDRDSNDGFKRINLEQYIRIFGLPVCGLETKINEKLNKEDFMYLFCQYLNFSEDIKEFWSIYWYDPADEEQEIFANNEIIKIQEILKKSRPRLSSFSISSDFDILYNIYHDSYSRRLEDCTILNPIIKENNVMTAQINLPEFTKMVSNTGISASFLTQWILLMEKLKFRKIDEYEGAWAVYYYLLNEKILEQGKTIQEKEKARERKKLFFKLSFAYSFYLNS